MSHTPVIRELQLRSPFPFSLSLSFMGRKSRQLHVRLVRAAVVVVGAAFFYQRWQLRSFGVCPASTYRTSASTAAVPDVITAGENESTEKQSSSARPSHWARLQSSSVNDPFDVLVVGGGLTGLYTAVDAAQRGLRVALVEAADVGGGSTTADMPALSPGAFSFLQRAIRQRDADWLRVAMTAMEEETTWRSVAGNCVVAPPTVGQRVRRRVTRMTRAWRSAEDSGMQKGEDAVQVATMLLPALHSSEMVEYTCAAVLSTLLSLLCGPLQPVSILSAAAVQRRLPSLSSACSSGANADITRPAVHVKGGVVTSNMSIESNTAAVALALTAEELGVVLCTYSPVTHITEHAAAMDEKKLDDTGTDEAKKRGTSWLFGKPAEPALPCVESPLMVAHVRDALAAVNAETPQTRISTSASSSSWLSRWLPPRAAHNAPSAPSREGTTSAADTTAETVEGEADTTPASSAVVYARSIVNCTGCSVDKTKALFCDNNRDTVPAAFEGYLAYSYLVAPADAIHASAAPPTISASPSHTDNACARNGVDAASSTREGRPENSAAAPLFFSTHTTGLHFCSPRLSFASVMALPWWDHCVLLGPTISPLSPLLLRRTERDVSNVEGQHNTSEDQTYERPAGGLDGGGVIQSRDGYAAQRERVVSMLDTCGVTVDTPRLLSCVTQVVPFMKSPKEAPFQRELLDKGYALRFSSVPVTERDGALADEAISTDRAADVSEASWTRELRRNVSFLHVYGGTPLLARRVAEDAVNALVQHPAIFDAQKRRTLYGCRTRRLQLTMPTSLVKHGGSTGAFSSSASASPPSDALARLQALIADTYAERLTDVVARRTHVAYTSPSDALQALPAIAAVMASVKGWSKAREEAELAAARHLVASVAVTTPGA